MNHELFYFFYSGLVRYLFYRLKLDEYFSRTVLLYNCKLLIVILSNKRHTESTILKYVLPYT